MSRPRLALTVTVAIASAAWTAPGVAAEAAPAAAPLTTLYVAQGGSNANDCSTPAAACATITHALTQAASGATIEVSGTIHDNVNLTTSVTITGANAPSGSPAVIDGSNNGSVFWTHAVDPVTLESLRIQHGSADFGGGIYNSRGPLTIIDTTVSANQAVDDGGGIYHFSSSKLTLIDSRVSGNATTCDACISSSGGGVYVDGSTDGDLVVIGSTVSGNTSVSRGGGIGGNGGTVTLTRSTVSGNDADESGGGVYGSNITLNHSTISGNTATFGGGVFVLVSLKAIASTIAANSATGHGGGIVNQVNTVTLGDTIIAGNTRGNCTTAGEGTHTWVSLGFNLTDDDGVACGLDEASDIVNADPALGPLADNGGPTQTMLPSGAAAIEAVPLNTALGGVTVCPGSDQRGYVRPASGSTECAIGAVEPGSSAPSGPVFSVSPTSRNYGSHNAGTLGAYQLFTVTNTGDADLAISSASLSGTDAGQFAKGTDNCTGATVAPAGTCAVQVRFSPTSTGAKTASLRFAHNAAGSPSDVSLTGTGTAPPGPAFSVSPTNKVYGDQQTGTDSAYQTFTVTNTGGANLIITTAALAGTDPSHFDKGTDTCTGATVAPAATCTVQVRFAPTSTGAKTATLRFTHNATGSPSDVSLTGTGAAPVFSVSPTNKVYGNQPGGTDSAYQTFTVTNTGGANLTITIAELAGTDPSQFDENADTCTGATVAPAATCTVQVRFSPTTTGAKTATLRFTHNAPGSPSDIALTGTGTAPAFSVTPTSKAYGDQQTGTDSTYQSFTVTNTGDADLTVPTAALTGTNVGQFAKGTDTCTGATVAPAATCTVQVRFSPTTTGAKTATLRFTHNAAGSPSDIALTGTGTAPAFSVTPTSKAYGDQLVGTASAYQSFTVTNTGDADLTVPTAALTGTDVGQFAKGTDTCTGATVAPAATCTVQVRFAPTSNGAKAASLRFTHNAAGTPSTIALTGAGITQLPQAITFTTAPPNQPTVGNGHDINATGGGSALPVTYSVHPSTTNGSCTVNATTGLVQFVRPGNCVIAADQAGNDGYLPAPQKVYPAMTVKHGQSIDTSQMSTHGIAGFSAYAYASGGPSGNPITYSSSTPGICTVNGNVITYRAPGTCSLTINQNGTTTYWPGNATFNIQVIRLF